MNGLAQKKDKFFSKTQKDNMPKGNVTTTKKEAF
jgi:hypothetical protein